MTRSLHNGGRSPLLCDKTDVAHSATSVDAMTQSLILPAQ